MKRVMLVLASLLVLTMVFTACAGPAPEDTTQQASSGGASDFYGFGRF